MAAAVVTVIIEDFLQSLGEGMKIGQQWGVKHELIEIHGLLSSIVEVLPEAENKYGHSLELQKWVRRLKEAAYDADDLLEELSVEEALWKRKRKVHCLFRPIVRLSFGRSMRDALQAVSRRLQELILSYPVSFVRYIPAEIGEAHEEARAIPLIGRDYKKRELMRHLWGGMLRDLPILLVHGDQGIGKTALVREVLSESKVTRHYDVIIWVNASPPFDENRMARDIIACLTKGDAAEEENVVEEQLLVCVWKLLDGKKKYLFILDDLSVHNSERRRWLRFCSFLKGGAKGSKILVTTRDLETTSYKESVLYLEGLTQEDSRDLLLKTAFKGGVEEIIDPAKLEIIEEMAALCHGSPLNIRAVGGYLSLQHDTSDWATLRDMVREWSLDLSSTLLYGSYPYGHLGPMVKRYYNLPPRIKRCFGLCSLFPRGHAIDRQTLAELWIALGYIKPSNEDYQPLEDIAYNYFDRLLMEELFQNKKFDTFGKVRSVVLHPDAEDLARSLAGWECRALRWSDSYFEEGLEIARHISFINLQNISPFPFNFRRLQTVLYFGNDHGKTEVLYNNLIRYIKWARVLDVHDMNVEAVPEGVWKLKHLRYLNLSDNRRIETLPPEMTDLLNLQTLKLSGCWALRELSKDMRKMVALRHLYIDNAGSCLSCQRDSEI